LEWPELEYAEAVTLAFIIDLPQSGRIWPVNNIVALTDPWKAENMHGTQAFNKVPLQVAALTHCPKCDLEMRLAYLVPERPGYDLRTFECRNCGLEETSLRSISFPDWRSPRAHRGLIRCLGVIISSHLAHHLRL
jgi:hypothetical protein